MEKIRLDLDFTFLQFAVLAEQSFVLGALQQSWKIQQQADQAYRYCSPTEREEDTEKQSNLV